VNKRLRSTLAKHYLTSVVENNDGTFWAACKCTACCPSNGDGPIGLATKDAAISAWLDHVAELSKEEAVA
jgi:hypothetical protein